MKKLFLALSVGMLIAFSSGCGANNISDNQSSEQKSDEVSEKSSESKEDDKLRNELLEGFKKIESDVDCPQLKEMQSGETVAVISTNMGDIKVRFFPEYAPKAVENFVTHAKEGYYDGVIFHRVIKDFMIQGGDPEGTGAGGESIWGEPFAVESAPNLMHIRGALCMAKTNDPISIGSQFYIVQNSKIDQQTLTSFFKEILDNMDKEIPGVSGVKYKDYFPAPLMAEYLKNGGCPHLDYNYTVFGQVYEGMDIVDKIAEVKTDANDKPENDVVINKIEVKEY